MTVPCPECGAKDGYDDMGPYRTQCVACGALLKHAEVRPGDTPRSPVVIPEAQERSQDA